MTINEQAVTRLQGASSKMLVREILLTMIKPTILKKLQKTGLRMLTLPGINWEGMEEIIIAFCKKHGIQYTIVGIERDYATFLKSQQNMPKDENVKLIHGDFDNHLRENIMFYNLVFADYMGGWNVVSGKRSLDTFYKLAKETKGLCLFFVTFSTMGRGCGKDLMSNIGYSQELKWHIRYHMEKVETVQPVLQINYKGEEAKHRMVVLGFAINFGKANDWNNLNDDLDYLPNAGFFYSSMKNWHEPHNTFRGVKHNFLPFDPVNKNLLGQEVKSYSVLRAENNTPAKQKERKQKERKQILSMLKSGVANDVIAKNLGISQQKVGGTQAWYKKTVQQGKAWRIGLTH